MKQAIDYSYKYTPEETDMYDLVSFRANDVEASAVGFHPGGDISYFFTNHMGVGRVFSFGAGVRFRF